MSIPALFEDATSVRKIEILTRRIVNEVMAGEYHSVFKGQGMDFNEVREYQPGDDIRSIDWNVTARTHIPHVKRYVEERELTVLFMVDLSASTLFGSGLKSKRSLAVLATAVLAFSAMQNNDRVGLILFSDHVEQYIHPKKGRSHGLRLLSKLMHAPVGRKTDIVDALQTVNRLQRRKAVVFLLSDFMQQGIEQTLSITSKRHDLITLTVRDPREQTIPNIGIVELEDAETGQIQMVDTSHKATRQYLEGKLKQQERALSGMFRKNKIDHIELNTGQEDIWKPLIQFFHRRAARKGG